MEAFLFRVLGAGVALAVLICFDPAAGHAQPGPGASAPPAESTRSATKQLVEEGIAAQDAKDYSRAIALYLRAFSLDPHPLLLFNVAQAYRLAGCPERAVPFYERYLTLEPKGTQAATARALLVEIKRDSKPDGAGCAKTPAAEAPAESLPAEVARPTGRLKLRSTPDGVIVMLDGEKIGVTPMERDIAAGEHTIVLVDGGTRVGERQIKILAGATIYVTMPVVSPPDHVRFVPPPPPSRVVPISLFAGAGLALVVSGYMFYLGQQGGPEHREDRYQYPHANTTGFVLVGAGAAAIGAGVWLWVRGSGEARESAPVATISPDGGYFGWQGRF